MSYIYILYNLYKAYIYIYDILFEVSYMPYEFYRLVIHYLYFITEEAKTYRGHMPCSRDQNLVSGQAGT